MLPFQIAFALLPVVAYVPQYLDIQRTGSDEGFSAFTSAILIHANCLRLAFWFMKRFDPTLAFQSLAMIISQLVLTELIVRKRRAAPATGPRSRNEFSDLFDPEFFWRWPDLLAYCVELLGFASAISFLMLVFSDLSFFVELVGAAALGLEAFLPLPQCIMNFKRRSTQGLNMVLILSWFGGDSFKTVYFFATGAPLQFLLCGLTQVAIDIVIGWQMLTYDSGKISL